jgi:hypothetical protein
MSQQSKIVDVRVEGDLYVAGKDEEGRDFIAENYMVVVEYANGEVYRHKQVWLGCRVEKADCEYDGPFLLFHDIRAESEASANRLCARVQDHLKNGGNLREEHWSFRRTAYGSQAYLDEVAEMTPAQRAGEDE